MDIRLRNNVREQGLPAAQPMLFAHGFGCDQSMWNEVAPAFDSGFRVVLFDHVGAGGSDLAAYDSDKYGTLQGYADDVVEICCALELEHVVFVGHSVSAMIGVLAAATAPELIEKLVLVGPSPRYTNDGDYVGGFDEADIDELLTSLDDNYLGWASSMGPVIMGNSERPELGTRLTESFCRTDPEIAKEFATVTFRSDNRKDLRGVQVPTLILQCSNDPIAPNEVGEFVQRSIPQSTLVVLRATGHCPNVSAPGEVVDAIGAFVW
jgi:sigma-B regulation protein RsbQ